jgi:hypothetical protein
VAVYLIISSGTAIRVLLMGSSSAGAVFVHRRWRTLTCTSAFESALRPRGVTPWVPTYPQPLLGASNNTGWICGATAATDITNAGFLTVTNCGFITRN